MSFTPSETQLLLLLIALLAWLGKRYVDRLDGHISGCEKRAIENAQVVQWVGDCMVTMGEQLKINLPQRPGR